MLLIGIIVLVLGLLDASSASSDLSTAQRKLTDQQTATQHAQSCEQAYKAALAPVIADGNAVLSTATQIAGLDTQRVAAFHDEQAAGVASNVDNYNAAADRYNTANHARSAAIDTLNQQLNTFTQAANATPGCGI